MVITKILSASRLLSVAVLIVLCNVIFVPLQAQKSAPNPNIAYKKLCARYIDLATTQQELMAMQPCSYIFQDDIIETLLSAVGALSQIEDVSFKKTALLECKKNPLVASYLKDQFSVKLAFSNLESNLENNNSIDELSNTKVVQNALVGSIFHGPPRGIYGSTSYYKFFSTYVEYHHDEDVEADGPWKVERLSYKLIQGDGRKIILLIRDQKYNFIHEDDASKLFKLTGLDESFEETFYETDPGECSA